MSTLIILEKQFREKINQLYSERGNLWKCETQSDIARYWEKQGMIDGFYEALIMLYPHYSWEDWEESKKQEQQK